MANLLQSSQTQATTAPQYYTDYLSNLASQGQTAAANAQYAGAQPLQQQAFQDVSGAASAFQPTLSQAGNVLTQAAQSTNPLAAGTPYMLAASGSPAALASQYMNPYIQNAVQGLSDVAMRDIQQNLAPQATAAAVGSGQFGSQRGAQVQGQVEANALQNLGTQIAQQLATGYGQALTAGTAQNQLFGQLGSTAGQLASAGQQNLTQAGGALSSLAGQNQALNLADINALSTLGGQQQTIAQNAQNYPLTKLASLAALLQGQQIPSTVTTQLNMSPLSGLATIGSGVAGLFQGSGTNGTGPSIFQQLTGSGSGGSGTSILNQIQNAFGLGSGTNTNLNSNSSNTIDANGNPVVPNAGNGSLVVNQDYPSQNNSSVSNTNDTQSTQS
jgi:hypothetical protein